MDIQLSQAIEGFLLAKEIQGASPYTLRNYRLALKRFREFLGQADPPLRSLQSDDIRHFIHELQTAQFVPAGVAPRPARSLSAKTIRNIHTTLSSFFAWAQAEGYTTGNIARAVTPPTPPPVNIEPFTRDQIQALLDSTAQSRPWSTKPDVRNRQPNALRDRLIILLLLDTGVRASELCNLRLDDISLRERSAVVRGKSRLNNGQGKERAVYFSKRTANVLWRYIHTMRPDSPHDNLILTQDGRPFERRSLAKLLRRIGERAGVPDVHPHRFRHTFAIQYLRNGGDIFTLQRLLGHTSLDMVRRYLAIAQTDVENAHRRASPVENWHL